MRRYARRALAQALPLTMLVMPANAAPMRMSTPDGFISVPIQPRKLMRACIIPGWSMTFVQHRGSFHWTRHAVWYSWRSTVRWVYCIPKLLRVLWYKGSYYSVGVSRRWVDHWPEHDQYLGLLDRACHQSILLSIETCPLNWLVVPVDLRQPCSVSLLTEHDCRRLKLWLFSRQRCRWKQRWVHLIWPENDQNIRNI